jgi:hypothetical protein
VAVAVIRFVVRIKWSNSRITEPFLQRHAQDRDGPANAQASAGLLKTKRPRGQVARAVPLVAPIVCRRELPAEASRHSQGPTILQADHAHNELGFRRTTATRNTFSTLGSFPQSG